MLVLEQREMRRHLAGEIVLRAVAREQRQTLANESSHRRSGSGGSSDRPWNHNHDGGSKDPPLSGRAG